MNKPSPLTQKNSPQFMQVAEQLLSMQKALLDCPDNPSRANVVERQENVQLFLSRHESLNEIGGKLSFEDWYLIQTVIALGQGPHLIEPWIDSPDLLDKLRGLAAQLAPVERFYLQFGGLVGYHLAVLELLERRGTSSPSLEYQRPPCEDIRTTTPRVRSAIIEYIHRLSQVGEVFVVGGAGDRLGLVDEVTGEALPAARLQFAGTTLLEGLVHDVQAHEYLHYKLLDKQVRVPIAMMTSDEKKNHAHILAICEEAGWFGRPKDSFFLFNQPLTPLIDHQGRWCVAGPMQLACKPGGHGVVWKLMRDHQVFDWFKKQGCDYALVHQINNPISSLDYGTLAFAGFGLAEDYAFGFCTCDRRVNTAEGMVVLEKQKNSGSYTYGVTNIEYTEFSKCGIPDLPAAEGGGFSAFPANSNILFVHLPSVEAALVDCPLPGLLLNMKTEATVMTESGEELNVQAGRLESTMQNIADSLKDRRHHPLSDEEDLYQLRTYATYNHRNKTLAVAKNSYQSNKSVEGTPWGAFYHLQDVLREALVSRGGWDIPPSCQKDKVSTQTAPYLIWLHPALGPLFSIIVQKLRGGRLARGAELLIEAAEVDLEGVQIDGSLRILADEPLGNRDDNHSIAYSDQGGKCCLQRVSISNLGLDHSQQLEYWRGALPARESVTIFIHGNGEFEAKDVHFKGEHTIIVEEGERVTAVQDSSGSITYRRESLQKPSWTWQYSLNEQSGIQLSKKLSNMG